MKYALYLAEVFGETLVAAETVGLLHAPVMTRKWCWTVITLQSPMLGTEGAFCKSLLCSCKVIWVLHKCVTV